MVGRRAVIAATQQFLKLLHPPFLHILIPNTHFVLRRYHEVLFYADYVVAVAGVFPDVPFTSTEPASEPDASRIEEAFELRQVVSELTEGSKVVGCLESARS